MKYTTLVSAFNETKSISEWMKDPRCKVNGVIIMARLNYKWTPEQSISTPSILKNIRYKQYIMITAFGETKPLTVWSRDPRCLVNHYTFMSRIVRDHMDPEKALTSPALSKSQYVRKRKVRLHTGIMITAFDEKKSILEWARDPRCNVCVNTLRSRIYCGMDEEKAITMKSRTI